MDGARFDQLTRDLSTGTRRTVLRGLVGAAVAGLAARWQRVLASHTCPGGVTCHTASGSNACCVLGLCCPESNLCCDASKHTCPLPGQIGCQLKCPNGQERCPDGSCPDFQTDPLNCGGCGFDCTEINQGCIDGQCGNCREDEDCPFFPCTRCNTRVCVYIDGCNKDKRCCGFVYANGEAEGWCCEVTEQCGSEVGTCLSDSPKKKKKKKGKGKGKGKKGIPCGLPGCARGSRM